MNTFNKKSLYIALAGLGIVGATGVAQAVNLNPNGLGQVLIYPYYTVNATGAGTASVGAGGVYNSLLSVVNSTGSTKAVKVRFLEARNSREVLDFNLFLTPHDVWAAAIVPTAAGGARVLTRDQSCILPLGNPGYDSIRVTGPGAIGPGVDFVNYAYTDLGGSGANDKGGAGLDRTREGYVEIIEMATYAPTSLTYARTLHASTTTSTLTRGVPVNCNANNDADAFAEAFAPSGGLFGGISLVNVNAGTDTTEDAVALDNFSTQPIYFAAGDIRPTFEFAAPYSSVTFNGTGGIVQSNWTKGVDAVSASLMHSSVLNEYVLDAATLSGTDWVLTMPTKRFYVSAPATGPASGGLFEQNFNGTAGSCDTMALSLYDREEQQNIVSDFSPPRVGAGLQLCWEANVLTYNNSNLLGSPQTNGGISTQNIATGGFQNGWAQIAFPTSTSNAATHRLRNSAGGTNAFGDATGTIVTPINGIAGARTSATYFGLPVVGFAVQSFNNGSVTVGTQNLFSSYGGNFVHKYTTQITAP